MDKQVNDLPDPGGIERGRYDRGMGVRRKVLGEAHVNRAGAAMTGLDKDFQTFITEGAWGSVWARDGLTLRERSMITLALLAAFGHGEEFAMHVRATARTGATPDDIRETLMHVAVYAGVPSANSAFKIARAELAGMEPSARNTEPSAKNTEPSARNTEPSAKE